MDKILEDRYKKHHNCNQCNAFLFFGINYKLSLLERRTYKCMSCISHNQTTKYRPKTGFVKKQQPPQKLKTKLTRLDNPYSSITPNLFSPPFPLHLYDRCKDKKCVDCNTPLTLGGNLLVSKARQWNYICKSCSKIRNANKRKRKVEDCTAGVYGLFDNGHLVYIGESKSCEMRWATHFYFTSTNSKSNIGWDRNRRDEYEFRMIYEEDNVHKRLVLELELIARYKPLLNHPYKPLYDEKKLEYILGPTYEDLLKEGF